MMMLMEGIATPVITPFREDGGIDRPGCRAGFPANRSVRSPRRRKRSWNRSSAR